MSITPGFLDELRSRLSLAQVVGRKVIWDQRKSNQGRGDWWSPCPFHHEKTASFHVDDQKGYYYCFGCHAKGDLFSFVRETENVDFIEAVRILTAEAGMQMPERDPQAQKKADRRTVLTEIMEQAVRHFRLMLRGGGGAAARAYLAGRGLDEAALERWEIGFAPDAWQGLWDHLRGQGVAEDLILAAGLAKPSQKGGKPYDTFRDRIMFPIRDGRGRCVAFGGRAMKADDPAKYLNSPETELFDKSRTLFNYGPARAAVGKGAPLIVAEGYMDVIALCAAGFDGAVAPLGTAVTESQLEMLWRVAPEPVMALDGDKAGRRAAYRAMDLSLGHLRAGRSLRFALMPEGRDPDDVLRSEGAGAVAEILSKAMPLVDLLWMRETEGQVIDSPDRRAALDARLREKIGQIQDQGLRGHYERAVRDMAWQAFNTNRNRSASQWQPKGRNGHGKWQAQQESSQQGTRQSMLVNGDLSTDALREAVILAVLLHNGAVLPEFIGALEEFEWMRGDHAAICNVLIGAADVPPDELFATVREKLGPAALENLFSHPHLQVVPALRAPDPEKARACVGGELAQIAAARGHARELAEAMEELAPGAEIQGGEHIVRRLEQSSRAKFEAGRNAGQTKVGQFDRGDNGHSIDRDERRALDALVSQIIPQKPD